MCGIIYDVASFGQRLISTINTSAKLHNHAEVDNVGVPTMKTFAYEEHHPVISIESIADRWHVSMSNQKQTHEVTTQKGVKSLILPLSQLCKADHHFNRATLKEKWYADWIFGRTKSLDGNLGAQVFANK